MAEKTVKALPLVPQQYDPVNESINRRTIEQAIQDVNSEIGHVKDMQESGVSKAVKRHIFLLMGASHCLLLVLKKMMCFQFCLDLFHYDKSGNRYYRQKISFHYLAT